MNAFANYPKDEELLRLRLNAYAQVFPNFVVPPFVVPSPVRTTSRNKSKIVNMGGVEEKIETTMEVDSITTDVATESNQVALDTIEATTKTMHPSTLSTIIESEEGTKNLQLGDGIRVILVVDWQFFW